ncbi:hypothetical protein EB796_007952 [Bugula neritina]|uniref:lysozyme n=1 Tax=Bugula neritina TaxID=10212 RepID=A0A7J7K690_BUGNE|nr:hypothetical protein EB796_007952 [Bugula neritina]
MSNTNISCFTDPDFRNCTTDYDCATECVKAWQDKYKDGCLIGRQRRVGFDYEQLQCADYVRMHFFGHLSCAWLNSKDVLTFLAKQEPKCGCSSE